MSRDDWTRETRRIAGRKSAGEAVLAPVTNDERSLRIKESAEAAMMILKQVGAKLDESTPAKPVICISSDDPSHDDVARQAINALGFDFRKKKDNPVQVRCGDVFIDAVRLVSKCHDKGWDCTVLIPAEAKARLLAMAAPSSPIHPLVATFNDGGTKL